MNTECQALARSIILFKLGSGRDTVQDVDDVCADVMVRLLGVLKQGAAIADLPAYVARTAYNACHDYFRRHLPHRQRSVVIEDVEGQLQVAPVDILNDDHRWMLQRTWREVLALPLGQRMALLLNLRAPEGGDALRFFPQTGVAAKDDIADALEMPQAELENLWDALPLDDAAIGVRMGLTRQQVINLRKSARKRLERRTSGGMLVQ